MVKSGQTGLITVNLPQLFLGGMGAQVWTKKILMKLNENVLVLNNNYWSSGNNENANSSV